MSKDIATFQHLKCGNYTYLVKRRCTGKPVAFRSFVLFETTNHKPLEQTLFEFRFQE